MDVMEKEFGELICCFHRLESLYNIKCMELKVAKSVAIKEFADRLKEDCPGELLVIHFNAIDKLIKEMVGDM